MRAFVLDELLAVTRGTFFTFTVVSFARPLSFEPGLGGAKPCGLNSGASALMPVEGLKSGESMCICMPPSQNPPWGAQ